MTDLPQLRMRHELKSFAPLRSLPHGCFLRSADEEDAEDIGIVLESAFLDPWPSSRVLEELLENEGVPETYVVEWNGEIVGTASYQEQPNPDPSAGWLHYVGVHPNARGAALGEILSQRVLIKAVSRGRTSVFLTTDDPRLSAIRTYLRIGFEPDFCHPSHEDRWHAVVEALK